MITGHEKILHIEFDIQGETLKASLILQIMNMEQKLERDRICVRMAGDTPYDQLPSMAKLRIFALATCQQAIKETPSWVNEWIGKADHLLFSIFEEVNTHEREFFRLHMEQGTAAEEKSPIRIRQVELPSI